MINFNDSFHIVLKRDLLDSLVRVFFLLVNKHCFQYFDQCPSVALKGNFRLFKPNGDVLLGKRLDR